MDGSYRGYDQSFRSFRSVLTKMLSRVWIENKPKTRHGEEAFVEAMRESR